MITWVKVTVIKMLRLDQAWILLLRC